MKFSMKTYFQPSFLLCVAVLAGAGVSKKAILDYTGAKLNKLPIPLKKPFDLMDEAALRPYKVVEKTKIENKDIQDELGTDMYIQWVLEDTVAAPTSPTKLCSLFITYYTGNPDRIPHVPEECFVGGGYEEIAGERGTLELDLEFDLGQSHVTADRDPSLAQGQSGLSRRLRARYLVFAPKSSVMWGKTSKFARMYFFKVNDSYASNRIETQKVMYQNVLGKYSYFCKVEWGFSAGAAGGNVSADKEEIALASEKLFSVLLPILERDHWPDW
jgi:hypothetical protein